MLAKLIFSMIKISSMLSVSVLLLACQSGIPPEFGMVDWYVSNGSNNNLTLNIYDKVCRQNHFRVRVPRATETPISTCANSAGNAEIRYQRSGGYSVTENPVRNDVVSSNQSLLVN